MSTKLVIVLQDELYNEILNGFTAIQGRVDNKITNLHDVYKKRLKNVGEAFLSKVPQFTKEYIGNLKSSGFNLEKHVNQLVQNFDDANDEDEDTKEAEVDEKTDRNIFDVFGLIRLFKYLSIIRGLYSSWKKFKSLKNDAEIVIDEYDSVDQLEVDQNIKNQLQISKIESLFSAMMNDVIVRGCDAIVKRFDESALIKKFFDILDAEVRKVGIIASIKGGLFILTNVYTGGVSLFVWMSRIGKIANAGWTLYSTKQLYDMITSPLKEFAQSFDEDAVKRMRDEINEMALSQTSYIIKEFDEMNDSISSILDVNQFVNNQANQFRQDMEENLGFIKKLNKGISSFNYKSDTIYDEEELFGFKNEYDNQGNLQIKYVEMDIDDTVGESMIKSHSLRYNFVVTSSTYLKIYDKDNGLHVIRKLKMLQESIKSFYVDFYNGFDKMITGINDKINQYVSNEMEKYVDLKQKDETKNESNIKPVQTKKSEVHPPTLGHVESSNGYEGIAKKEKINKGKLRLSERSLQPIHPIFHNNALLGIELRLIDQNDKEILISINDWFNDSKNYIKQDKGLKSLKEYVKMLSNHDNERNYILQIVEQEENMCQHLTELLDKIKNETL